MLFQASCPGVDGDRSITIYDKTNDCTGNVHATTEVVNEMHSVHVAGSGADGCFDFRAAG